MSICPNTGLTLPECSCVACLQRQLEQFAPDRMSLRRMVHDPLVMREVRPLAPLPTPVHERLDRPVL